MKYLLIIALFFPLACFPQTKITGRVLNQSDKTPLANASVFLSNATIGTKTGDDGSFSLNTVRGGQYELVVTMIGHETYRKEIMLTTVNINLPDILIASKTTQLSEVKVGASTDWERNYQAFLKDFLGSSSLALQCKILNPEMLNLDYDRAKRTLTASSYDFLEIENQALGYKIKYLLTRFIKDSKSNFLYFEGSALFENMEGSAAKKKRWQKKRNEVYAGSSMHFLRSVIANDMENNHFKVLRLIRKKAPDYNGFNNKYNQTLVTTPLKTEDFVRLTDNKGLFALTFPDCLYIMYTKKKDRQNKLGINRPADAPDYATSIVTFDEPYGFFDNNGIITNPTAILFEGNWGNSRMAELLPVDFEPGIIK